jgi:hypothetical protein
MLRVNLFSIVDSRHPQILVILRVFFFRALAKKDENPLCCLSAMEILGKGPSTQRIANHESKI